MCQIDSLFSNNLVTQAVAVVNSTLRDQFWMWSVFET